MSSAASGLRDRADRCPGVLRPWVAEDGGLVRLRLIGGALTGAQLGAVASVAERFGAGELHLTKRANLQVRGLPLEGTVLPDDVVAALVATGLVPAPAHERARNVMVSPLSGVSGGRADLRPVAAELDRLLCADPDLAALPGRFLFVLDDGRGDLVRRPLDLGMVAVDADRAQLRLGTRHWGPVVTLADAAPALVGQARAFLRRRGRGPGAAWHVDELRAPLADVRRDPATAVAAGPLPHGPGPGYDHRAVPGGVLGADEARALARDAADRGRGLVVTPWHGLLLLDPS